MNLAYVAHEHQLLLQFLSPFDFSDLIIHLVVMLYCLQIDFLFSQSTSNLVLITILSQVKIVIIKSVHLIRVWFFENCALPPFSICFF